MDGWSRQPRAEPRLSLPLTPSTNGIRRTPFDVEKASSASRHSTGMGILSRDAFSRISWPWRSPSRSTGRRPSQTYMDVAETQYISQCSTGSLAAMLTEPLYIIYYALTATYYRLLIHACIVSLANYPRAYISMYVRRDQPRPRPKIKKTRTEDASDAQCPSRVLVELWPVNDQKRSHTKPGTSASTLSLCTITSSGISSFQRAPSPIPQTVLWCGTSPR